MKSREIVEVDDHAIMSNMAIPNVYILAVSGGVDSVVLLDIIGNKKMFSEMKLPSDARFVVAHFDHGVRKDSADDAKFVGELAARYGLMFETAREELGPTVSEDIARRRRYEFLRKLAKKYEAKIITAHHADDVIETIVINFIRGTGWRGLAVLDSADIVRPLLHLEKSELIEYAHQHKLIWHEDSTNNSDQYLRNRLRRKLSGLDNDSKWQLLALRDHQVESKHAITDEAVRLIGDAPYSRYFFITTAEQTAIELLRAVCIKETKLSPLSSQLQRALMAIKVAGNHTRHDVGNGIYLQFTRSEFIVKTS